MTIVMRELDQLEWVMRCYLTPDTVLGYDTKEEFNVDSEAE